MIRLDSNRRPRSGSLVVVLVCAAVSLFPSDGRGQSFRGSTASTLGGVALGTYSGSVLGMMGSIFPCNRTLYGPKCAATGASVGGALGVAMGGLIGAQNQEEIVTRLEGAGVGALVGAGVGLIFRQAVRQYEWEDAATVAVIGGAFGAAPTGSGIGAGAGAVVGSIVWLTFPKAGLPDFLMFTLAGAAVGGLVDWADGASRAKRDGSGSRFSPTFSIPVG